MSEPIGLARAYEITKAIPHLQAPKKDLINPLFVYEITVMSAANTSAISIINPIDHFLLI